ncbi:FAD/NAD(P)-binding oxidoreductase [Pseudarthrobacter sp. ATCC 49987]|uniref:FAD/NAD(P)-binding oxidoreductase n=1 Tax=Pseudarthrobacter sp. ATCC 49987 TaxID=2698204 RepID=UPI001F3FBE21|nr:FAD/NAD(P)-binding oxidoreductase [Pseudarthrobacter sp. ATCC 49987]
MPQGAAWLKDAATDIDPERRSVALASGGSVTYDYLVVSPGIQLDWEPGMFGVKVFADELERVVAKYGVELRFNSEMTAATCGCSSASGFRLCIGT